MLDLLRAEPWQEWPPLLPGPFHPVLGHLPPTASPSGPQPQNSPETLRSCGLSARQASLLQGSPLLASAGTAPRARKAQSHHQALFTGDILNPQDPHEAQSPRTRPRSSRLPSLASPDKGCHSGGCSPASSLQQLQHLARRKVVLPGALGLLSTGRCPSLAGTASAPRMACSNKGRFIPSTHASTRAHHAASV